MVEWYENLPSDVPDYIIGEMFPHSGDVRWMDRPSRDGVSPDCWSSAVGGMDVHYGSGVGDHFFYLLAEGSGAKTINGVDYDSPTCNGSALTGIGRDKAAAIWYRALTEQLTSSSRYQQMRTATLSAAAGLYGSGSAEYTAVSATWAAVNVT
jgi:Zn-dependent metalloprotease